jgi:hypothetical protein
MKHMTDLSMRLLRRAAANADADIRTTVKVALGAPVRGIVGERVAEELRKLGVEVPAPGVVRTADQVEQEPARAVGGGS